MEEERWTNFLDQELVRADSRHHFLWTFVLVLVTAAFFLLEAVSVADRVLVWVGIGLLGYRLVGLPLVRKVLGTVNPDTVRRKGTDQEFRVLAAFMRRHGPAVHQRVFAAGDAVVNLFLGSLIWHEATMVPLWARVVIAVWMLFNAILTMVIGVVGREFIGKSYAFLLSWVGRSKGGHELGVQPQTVEILDRAKLKLAERELPPTQEVADKVVPWFGIGFRALQRMEIVANILLMAFLAYLASDWSDGLLVALVTLLGASVVQILAEIANDGHRTRLGQLRMAVFVGDVAPASARDVYSVLQSMRYFGLNTSTNLFALIDGLVEEGVAVKDWRSGASA